MSTPSITGLLIMLLVFSACGLLISLYVWFQARREQLAMQRKYQSLLSKRDSFTPTLLHNTPHGSKVYTTFPATKSRFSWESTYSIVASDGGVKAPAASVKQASSILLPLRPTLFESFRHKNPRTELLANCSNPPRPEKGSMERSSVEYESAGLQPLPLVWTKQKKFHEQQVWRNSSGGSSCYSRPASWYSVIDLERGEDVSSLIRVGQELTPRREQEPVWKSKPLPALPIE